jgi:pyruvate/2-oxoglutarate dehydrogenase complex dihydrolipoamide dehydrogenase (E3) component
MMTDRKEKSSTRDGSVDVIVLGVGTCGEDLSLRLLDAGLSVVGIEASLVGGECAYWACLPSKMMIRASKALQEARRVNQLAGKAEVVPNWVPLAARVGEGTGEWDDSAAVDRFEKRGGRLIKGRGKLVSPNMVSVDNEQITASRGIVIATGSSPFIPPIQGLAETDFWTTHEVIQAETLPESLLVLGGGVVGCELGQVLARFGVKVILIEAGKRLLPSEEPEVSQTLEAAFRAEGLEIYQGEAATSVKSQNGKVVVSLDGGEEITGERLLVATGRRANTSELGLETVGLDGSERYIPVDEQMRAGDGIWAMGDVTGKAMFTHVALYQSAIIAARILGEDHPPARYDAVPRATFTDPEVGSVGMTEAQAVEAGLDIEVVVKQIPATFRGWVHGADHGIIKLIVDRKTGALAGATAAGPEAGEMLGFLTLAVHERVPLENLRSMIYAFPTFYGGIGEAIGAYGRGLTTVMDPSYEGVKDLDAVSR